MNKDYVPSADRIHHITYYMMGLNFPRAWLRALSLNKRRIFCRWVHNFWAIANDNNVRKVKRPHWVPKRYIYGRVL